jgi:hypothetical protein
VHILSTSKFIPVDLLHYVSTLYHQPYTSRYLVIVYCLMQLTYFVIYELISHLHLTYYILQILFLQEFCSLSKNLLLANQTRLFRYVAFFGNALLIYFILIIKYEGTFLSCILKNVAFCYLLSCRDLVDNGLFEIVTSALQSEDRLLRLTGYKIFLPLEYLVVVGELFIFN